MALKGDTLRVVLLGKTGAGKSSLGNALLNIQDLPQKNQTQGSDDNEERKNDEQLPKKKLDRFDVTRGLSSGTSQCGWIKKEHAIGIILEVVDTPGLCDTHSKESEIYKEVGKSVALLGDGPHVLIFTLKLGRFTKDEYEAFMTIKKMFPEIDRHLICVFTGLDILSEDKPSDSMDTIKKLRRILDEEVRNFHLKGGQHATLMKMIDAARGGYFGISNSAKEVLPLQVQDLVEKMLALRDKNGGKCYTTKVVVAINKVVADMVTKRAEEKHIPREKAEEEVKAEIIDDDIEEGFFESIGGIIYNTGCYIKDACSVM